MKLTAARIKAAKPGPAKYKLRDSAVPGLVVIVLPTGVKSFAVGYRLHGKSQELVLGKVDLLSLDDARVKAREYINAARAGTDPRSRKGLPFGQFLDQHYAPYAARHQRRGVENVARLRVKFAYLKTTRLEAIDLHAARRYESLYPGLSRATADRDLGLLKASLNWAVLHGLLEANGLAQYRRKKADHGQVVRYLRDDEHQRLMAALEGHRLRPLVLMALNTGMRRNELFALRREDVRDGVITVHGRHAKSGKTRRIPANAVVRELLAELPQSGLLFPSPRTGGKLTDIKSAWKTLMSDAGIENFRFHDCRHHFATELVAAGVPLPVVQAVLGHSNLAITSRYAHARADDLAGALERLV